MRYGWLAAAAALAFLAGCQASTAPMHGGPLIMTAGQARGGFPRSLEELVARYRPARERWQVDMVARVGGRIARVAGGARDWHLVVVDSPIRSAWAAFGNAIIVHSGLFEWVDNEHQLAVIIGHEAAHLTHHQSANDSMRDSHPFDRGKELEADRIGIEYAARAGYDPRQAIQLWRDLNPRVGAGAATSLTHPTPFERTIRAQAALDRLMPIYLANRNQPSPTPTMR